jgi:hypothetical protein
MPCIGRWKFVFHELHMFLVPCRLGAIKQLHSILLGVSLACMVLFWLLLYRPYIRSLHRDSKAVAGLLSQLPSEVDVEGHVKSVVLGIVKANDSGHQSMTQANMNIAGSQGYAAARAAGYALGSGGPGSMMIMPAAPRGGDRGSATGAAGGWNPTGAGGVGSSWFGPAGKGPTAGYSTG